MKESRMFAAALSITLILTNCGSNGSQPNFSDVMEANCKEGLILEGYKYYASGAGVTCVDANKKSEQQFVYKQESLVEVGSENISEFRFDKSITLSSSSSFVIENNKIVEITPDKKITYTFATNENLNDYEIFENSPHGKYLVMSNRSQEFVVLAVNGSVVNESYRVDISEYNKEGQFPNVYVNDDGVTFVIEDTYIGGSKNGVSIYKKDGLSKFADIYAALPPRSSEYNSVLPSNTYINSDNNLMLVLDVGTAEYDTSTGEFLGGDVSYSQAATVNSNGDVASVAVAEDLQISDFNSYGDMVSTDLELYTASGEKINLQALVKAERPSLIENADIKDLKSSFDSEGNLILYISVGASVRAVKYYLR